MNEYQEWLDNKQDQDEYKLWRAEQELKQLDNHLTNTLKQSFDEIFGVKNELLR